MTIKDKNGMVLHFGDTIRNEYQTSPKWCYYRFCYSGFRKGRVNAGLYGVFVNAEGKMIEFAACNDGSINHIIRVAAFSDLAEIKRGCWVNDDADDKPVVICSCCGSLIPTATELDKLTVEDNRYCSFCGAKMEVDDGEKD